MLEAGIGRAHNIALATLPNFVLPGDVSASKRYWKRDIIQPGRGNHAARHHRNPRRARASATTLDHDFIRQASRSARKSGRLNAFVSLLRDNHNYRNTWIGQVVSEVGDHFNNIAVFSLAVATTKIRAWWSAASCWRARFPAMLIGPVAGRRCSTASIASAS